MKGPSLRSHTLKMRVTSPTHYCNALVRLPMVPLQVVLQGVSNVETAALGSCLEPAHPPHSGSSPAVEEEPKGKEAKVSVEGTRREGPRAISPLASPRGLKEAVGVTVLVESMKLRDAQKIPERTLLSSFQDLSTLDRDTNLLTGLWL